MMGKHTPGPWQQRDDQTSDGWITIIGNVYGEYVDGRPECTYDVIARCEDEFGERLPNVTANAARIVACVNACEGIADPGAVLKLGPLLENVLELLEDKFDWADGEPSKPCISGDLMCDECRSNGCINLKILSIRAALARVRGDGE